MLPFEPTDKRQFVCFVCGVAHTDFNEFTKHIKEKHEEGRDYIVCPLKRCGSCVRDVVAHFKSRHSSEPLPKKGQLKAIIWADQHSPNKRKKKPNFKEGYVVSNKNSGKQMHYRSGYEKDVYMCLEHIDDVVSYGVENFKVEYFYRGKTHNYYPDLMVCFKDGHFEVWEIKPTNQCTLPVNLAKWEACKTYCLMRGWTFEVITETTIKNLKKLVNNKLILEQNSEE